MKKFFLTIQPSGMRIQFPEGYPLSEALADAGYPPDLPCGAKGICGRCMVKAAGIFTDKNSLRNFTLSRPEDVRSCTTLIAGDAEVFISIAADLNEIQSFEKFSDGEIVIAADIGTTSIQVSAVELSSGKKIRLPGVMNPQRRFGHDVISRIAAAADRSSADEMGRLVRDALAFRVKNLLEASRSAAQQIKKIVLSGNTAMTYILLGIDPSPLGQYPYSAPALDFESIDPALFGTIFADTDISAMPCASAYLGGDLIGGLALCDSMGCKENIFFIDLGTNGEIFVRGGSGIITASSCAMGPALEGMGVSMGMTASAGALSRVRISENKIETSVIGGTAPAGICGTGFIDLISAALELGLVNRTGLICKDKTNKESPAGISSDRAEKKITVMNSISVTQKDIRSLQLAKGASLAASEILLSEAGIDPQSIEKVIIAGSLGEHVNIDSFKKLSFLPEFKNAEWIVAGNTSLYSAEKAAADKNYFNECVKLRDSLKIIELASDPRFNDRFIEALGF